MPQANGQQQVPTPDYRLPATDHRLLIVSNRLPFTAVKEHGSFTLKESGGGLVSGLGSYLHGLSTPYVWVGWPGAAVENPEQQQRLKELAAAEYNAHPVFISQGTMDEFYYGFSNKTIWPLFHYFPVYTHYAGSQWENYIKVNRLFADAVLEIARPGDTIWIHDYHLMLMPRMVREKAPGIPTGFFLHIPFPSYEIFRLLPRKWGATILEGILGADLVGFHTHDYTQAFLRSVLRILGYEHSMGQIMVRDNLVKADTFPMGIEFEKYHGGEVAPEMGRESDQFKSLTGVKVVLSIDRLDYTKGIINRLRGYEMFLEKNPQWHGKVVLALVMIPSRVEVERYKQTKEQVERLVGRLNGQFGSLTWMPIVYQYRSLPFDLLLALYRASDVAMVTPLRDGMNLIAKEYVAARTDSTGVLILSEMAGAAKEMGEAVIINPNSVDEIADALEEALEMACDEQMRRNVIMQDRLRRYDVTRWAEDFLRTLGEVEAVQQRFTARLLSPQSRQRIVNAYARTSKRLIMLDYDGTLVPFARTPQAATPPASLLDLLKRLRDAPGNEVILVSGRDRQTLDQWFGPTGVGTVAEHGAWVKREAGDWHMLKPLTSGWKPSIRPVLELFADRLPGAFIEEKSFSLAWHYRNTDPELGSLRAKELLDHLVDFTANIDVQVLQGSKVIEVKCAGVNKGAAALHYLSKVQPDFVLAIGDDWTDEYLFMVLPESAYSIRVGMNQSHARFNLRDYTEVCGLLEELASSDVHAAAGASTRPLTEVAQ
jgi:trehalose 6-phosphate synthase/phosphatase